VERRHDVALALIAVAILLSASLAAWRFVIPALGPSRTTPPVGVAFGVTHVGGRPEMNTTEFWVARITRISTNASLSSYQGALLRNGSVLVPPVTVRPGQLGDSTHPVFEFFDSGSSCSPTPCPPPEGPDGNLSADDFFRISFPDPGTAYTVRVLWAATGEIVGEIAIET